MTRMRSSLAVSSLLAVLAFGAYTVSQPASVATVDLARVIEGLDKRLESEETLGAMGEKFKTEGERRQKELEGLAARQKDLKPGTPQWTELEEEIILKALKFQNWQKLTRDTMDLEKALLMEDLYRDIRAAIVEMAEHEGYDLVLEDDSAGELLRDRQSPLSNETQIKEQINARRVLYASPAIDATNHLIQRMNNAFRAGPK